VVLHHSEAEDLLNRNVSLLTKLVYATAMKGKSLELKGKKIPAGTGMQL
jgi:hypothetical protein